MAIPFAENDFVKNVHCKVFHLGANISFRFLLKIKLNNNLRNIITIILMNPSRATATKSDPTIDNIISFSFQKNMLVKSEYLTYSLFMLQTPTNWENY